MMDCPEQVHVVDASPTAVDMFRQRERTDYRLTSQERHLLRLLIDGHQKKTAAQAMGISVNTVSFHLKNIYLKLQVHCKTGAVAKALQEGLFASIECERCRGERLRSLQALLAETARYSHARANVHSRSTVARDTPTVRAISSMVSPPKNRSSTT